MLRLALKAPCRRASAALAALLLLCGPAAHAQAPSSPVGLPNVPTTRVLAIGHLTAKSTPAAMQSVMPSEVTETVKLYLAGKIADWYVRKDKPGVVFILDVRDASDARAILDGLPLGRTGLMEFDLVPVGPLAPLGLLLPTP